MFWHESCYITLYQHLKQETLHMERFKAKEELKDSMQKEIRLMREVLSNLFQEETSLLEHNQNSWNYLMQDRFSMTEKLKCFRCDRELAIEKLKSLSPINEKSLPIFEFLLSNDEDICEITLLLDQLIALTDKINEQNARNQNLSLQMQHLIAFTNTLTYSTETKTPSALRKNTLATISREENEDWY